MPPNSQEVIVVEVGHEFGCGVSFRVCGITPCGEVPTTTLYLGSLVRPLLREADLAAMWA